MSKAKLCAVTPFEAAKRDKKDGMVSRWAGCRRAGGQFDKGDHTGLLMVKVMLSNGSLDTDCPFLEAEDVSRAGVVDFHIARKAGGRETWLNFQWKLSAHLRPLLEGVAGYSTNAVSRVFLGLDLAQRVPQVS